MALEQVGLGGQATVRIVASPDEITEQPIPLRDLRMTGNALDEFRKLAGPCIPALLCA